MATIQNVEVAEKWKESIDRVVACCAMVKACVKAFTEGGASADEAMNATEAARSSLKDAMREEQARWTKMLEPPAQQEIPGTRRGEKPSGPRALPQTRMIGDGSEAT